MEIRKKEHGLYWVAHDDVIHLTHGGNNKRIIFQNSRGNGVTLMMNKETFDYLRKKMNRFNLSLTQKERIRQLRKGAKTNGTQKD